MDGKGELRRGDEVSWKSHGQNVTGKVKKKITKRTQAAGRTVAASDEEPQYEVESDASGRDAVHKPEALRKRDETVDAFKEAVHMTPRRLEKWLATDESKEVGQSAGSESVGHASGRRIVTLLRKSKADLDRGDRAHMRKVVGYVHRHGAQRPDGDLTETRWRYSLMNWGHDPLG